MALNNEISKAQADGKSFYVAMDSNRKLGTKYIPKDPNNISKNCEILADVVKRNALVVVNGIQNKCHGVITRQKNTENGRVEKGAIDMVIISADLEGDLVSLKIDEERVNVLTKISKNRKGKELKCESNHNILETDLNIKWKRNL